MRKAHLICFATVLAFLLLLTGMCFAENQESLPYYVSDTAGLMTSEEWRKLESTAENISEQYGCGVYIVTLQDYRDYGSYNNFWDFSEAFYTRYNMGLGEARNGILLIMSMAERDYSLLAYGRDAHYAFTDYGKEQLADSFLDNFRRDDWAGGFGDYIDNCGVLVARAKNGDPVDQWIPDPPVQQERQHGMTPMKWLISLLFPGLVGGATVSGMSRQMKTAVKKTRAEEYVGRGSPHLNVNSDQFINRNVTRQVIRRQENNSRPGGHYGGTTISGSP